MAGGSGVGTGPDRGRGGERTGCLNAFVMALIDGKWRAVLKRWCVFVDLIFQLFLSSLAFLFIM